jgi:hypothetical protein
MIRMNMKRRGILKSKPFTLFMMWRQQRIFIHGRANPQNEFRRREI